MHNQYSPNSSRRLASLLGVVALSLGSVASIPSAATAATDVQSSLVVSGAQGSFTFLGNLSRNVKHPPTRMPVAADSLVAQAPITRVVMPNNDSVCGLSAGKVYCWGTGAVVGGAAVGEVSGSSPVHIGIGDLAGRVVTNIRGGGGSMCANTDQSEIVCWGKVIEGTFPGVPRSEPKIPEPLVGAAWKQIAAGSTSACALKDDGTVWCWGQNRSGQLGTGGPTNTTTYYPAAQIASPVGVTFSALYGGHQSFCALDTGGAAYCWGLNGGGQLGLGDKVTRTTPQLLQAAGPYRDLATTLANGGTGHRTCGVRVSDGGLDCWGNGQLTPKAFSGGALTGASVARLYAPFNYSGSNLEALTEAGALVTIPGVGSPAAIAVGGAANVRDQAFDGGSGRRIVVADPVLVAPYVKPAAPLPVIGLKASSGDEMVTVTFDSLPGGGLEDRITMTPSADGVDPSDLFECDLWVSNLMSADDQTCTFGVPNGVPLTVSVVSSGLGGESAPLTITETAAGVPDPPLGLAAATGNATATITWTAGTSIGAPITGYTVYLNGTTVACNTAATVRTCTIPRLVNGRNYFAVVTVTNRVSESIASRPITFTPRAAQGTGAAAPKLKTTITGWTANSVTLAKPKGTQGAVVSTSTVSIRPAGVRTVYLEALTSANPTKWVVTASLKSSSSGLVKVAIPYLKGTAKYRLVVAESDKHLQLVSGIKTVKGI